MTRKSIFVMLAVLVAFSLVLGGCKKSATPPLPDIQSEDESAKMVEEAGSNPTPVVVQPATEEIPVVQPVEEATTAPTPAVTEVTETPTQTVEVVLPVVVTGTDAAATPQVAATPETTTTPGKHVVQAGENLFRIALKYNYSQYYLAKYNGISNPALIYVGQVIRIP